MGKRMFDTLEDRLNFEAQLGLERPAKTWEIGLAFGAAQRQREGEVGTDEKDIVDLTREVRALMPLELED